MKTCSAKSKQDFPDDLDQRERPDELKSPVCSYNEWDPLEEVIVGRVEGAVKLHYTAMHSCCAFYCETHKTVNTRNIYEIVSREISQ